MPRTFVFLLIFSATLFAKELRIVSTALVGDEILLELHGLSPLRLPEGIPPRASLGQDDGLDGRNGLILALSNLVDDERYSLHHVQAKAIQKRSTPNVEVLMGLTPDVIVAASFHKQDFLEQLKMFSTKVLVLSEFQSLEGIKSMYRQVGAATGWSKETEQLIANFEKEVLVLKAVSKKPHVLTWNPSWIVSGKKTLWDDVVTTSGGLNVASDMGLEGWGKINPESLFKQKVDVVILEDSSDAETEFHAQTQSRFLKAQVKLIKPAYLSHLSLRIIDVIKMLNGFYLKTGY